MRLLIATLIAMQVIVGCNSADPVAPRPRVATTDANPAGTWRWGSTEAGRLADECSTEAGRLPTNEANLTRYRDCVRAKLGPQADEILTAVDPAGWRGKLRQRAYKDRVRVIYGAAVAGFLGYANADVALQSNPAAAAVTPELRADLAPLLEGVQEWWISDGYLWVYIDNVTDVPVNGIVFDLQATECGTEGPRDRVVIRSPGAIAPKEHLLLVSSHKFSVPNMPEDMNGCGTVSAVF